MPTFVKTGFWEKVKQGYKGWLNLDEFVLDIVNNAPVTTTTTTTSLPEYKVYVAEIYYGAGQDPTIIVFKNTMTNPVVVVRDFAGQYSISCDDFLYSKTHLVGAPRSLVSTNNASGLVIQTVNEGQSGPNKKIFLTTRITSSITNVGTLVDYPGGYSIEIRVYP